jgi:hypothetical protein
MHHQQTEGLQGLQRRGLNLNKETGLWISAGTPIVQALSKWLFRPAQLNNQPVAVKVLVGIPL